MYVKREEWSTSERREKFLIANLVQVPSYISLSTALNYYDATTQVQREFYESVAVKRSKAVNIGGSVFQYFKLSSSLYNAFKKVDRFFIATPEKALLDAFYLMSYGRYSLDLSSMSPEAFDMTALNTLCRHYPDKTKKSLITHGYL